MTGGDSTVRPLILLPSDPFGDKIGGIKTFVLDFVRFAPSDFEPEIVGCSSDSRDRPVGRWQIRHVGPRPVRYLPVLRTPDPNHRPIVPLSLQFTLSAMLRRSARRYRGRILQFHHPGVPAGFLRVDAPKILVAHLNVADIDRGVGESRWTRAPGLLHRFEDVTLPRMDRIFVVNEAGVEFYRRRHPRVADRVSFLPTSVDQDLFRPLGPDARGAARSALLAEIGQPAASEARLVAFVGRLERQKNPILLVEAVARAAAADPSIHLVAVGTGSLREAAARRARELGADRHVHWLGLLPRDRLPDLLNAADALLLPSAFEGMPITVLEALACGLPVVATDVGGVGLVVHDGTNGRLTAADPTALADALAWTLARPRETFAAAARQAVAPFRPERAFGPFFDAHRELHERRWRV